MPRVAPHVEFASHVMDVGSKHAFDQKFLADMKNVITAKKISKVLDLKKQVREFASPLEKELERKETRLHNIENPSGDSIAFKQAGDLRVEIYLKLRPRLETLHKFERVLGNME